MNRTVGAAILGIIVLSGGYYWYSQNGELSMLQETDQQASAPSAPIPAKHSVTWKFETVAEAKDDGTPQKTNVTVTWDGSSHDGGTYEGSCAEIDGSNGTLQDGEVSAALCWFAGAGDEIGVFEENGGYVLKHGEQQEPSGEGAGFRGNFKTLITL